VPRRLKPFITLEGEQERASHPAAHAALSASAGTGKTHVLTARVLRLLMSGVDPAAILCLTFTKAGAAEMAHRIHERLAYWVRLKDKALEKELFALDELRRPDALNRARRLFAKVLEAPGGGLRIQTIHAFAQSLLAAFPAEAGLTPGFRPLEEREQKLLVRATLADLLVRAEAGGDDGLIRDAQQLSLRLGEQGAADLLLACARAPGEMEGLGPREGIEARLRHTFGLPLGDIEAAILDGCDEARFDCGALRRIAALNRAWGGKRGHERADLCEAWLAADASERARLLDGLHSVWATAEGALRSFGPGQAPRDEDYAALAAAAFEQCGQLRQLRRTAQQVALFAAGLRAGQAFAAAYQASKRAQGLVDFDDLIRMADGLLDTPGIAEWVRFKLDQQTDHILVDEAQDTNARQWRIVEALAGEYFAGQGASGHHRTLFTVGDFKQAIFSFQGTDPGEFEKAREHFGRRARAERDNAIELFGEAAPRLPPDFFDLSMDRSFRSSHDVLAVVDQVISQLGHEALGLPRAPNAHVAHAGRRPGLVALWRPVAAEDEAAPDEGEEGWLSDTVRRYATSLARQVATWLHEPFHVASEKRRLLPQDILILVRRRTDLAGLIVARLHAEGVPVAGIDRLSLTAPLAVQDLLAAARFAIQPLDDLNLASLLVSPLVGWTQDELFVAAHDRRGALWPHLRALGAAAPGGAVALLDDLLDQADYLTPHAFLERLLSGPVQGRRKLMARLGLEARDPIEELLSSALDFEKAGAPSLARFLDWFARGEVEIVRDPSAPLDAVRVMTVHGSKGLEAPVVILADACANPDAPGGGPRHAKLDLGDGLIVPIPRPSRKERPEPIASSIAEAERREREEHWRLLYVAMTRAKERLYLGGTLRAGAKGVPDGSWHRAVAGAVEALGGGWEEDARWGAALRHGTAEDRRQPAGSLPAGSASAEPVESATLSATSLPPWLTRPAPQEERPPRPLSPSAPADDDAPYPPPGPEQRQAALRGKLLHSLFERLPGLPAAERRSRAEAWLAATGDADDPDFRRDVIEDACRVIDDPAFAALFGPDALAEAPIAAAVPGGHVVAGTVDRLLVTPERVLVADFKTGRRVPAAAAEAPLSHLRQMAAYRAALSVIFPDRVVEAALLYTAAPVLLPLPAALLEPYAPTADG
jgi:ATP-dependent helicase/nuclease subunit A